MSVEVKGRAGRREPRHTLPLFPLCRLFGALPLHLPRRQLSALYAYLLHLPLAGILLAAKVYELVNDRRYLYSSVDSISLMLYLTIGLPDAMTVFCHLEKIRKAGRDLVAHFYKFHLRSGQYPKVYVRLLTPIGAIVYPSIMMFLFINLDLDMTITITSTVFSVTSYLVLMLFCCYLLLVKAQMQELLPIDQTSAVSSVAAHMELVSKALWCSDFFANQLFALTLRIIINIIVKTYHMLYSLNFTKNFTQLSVIFVALLWEFFLLGLMTRSCHKVVKQVEKFDDELFTVIRTSSVLYTEEKLKLYVNNRPKLTFSVSGFFNIGYPLVTSIIAASLTYLVILVQFSK